MIKYLDINRKIYADLDENKIVFNDEPNKSFNLKNNNDHKVLRELLLKEPGYCDVTALEYMLYREVRSEERATDQGVSKCVQKIRNMFNEKGIPCNRDKEQDADKITIENINARSGAVGGKYRIVLPKSKGMLEKKIAGLLAKNYGTLTLKNSNDMFRLADVFQRPLIVEDGSERSWSEGNSDPGNMSILLEAPNGYGKTVFLKSILLSSYCDYLEDKRPETRERLREIAGFHGMDGSFLCIYMECDKMAECEIDSGNSWIYRMLPEGRNSNDPGKSIEEREFLDLLVKYSNNKKLVLLLDGYDEMNTESRSRIRTMIGDFRKMSALAAGTKIIMATRPIFWSSETDELTGFKRFRISNENILKDREVFKGYVRAYSRVFTKIDADALFDEVKENFYLSGIICTPAVILWLLIVKNGESNIRIYELMEKLIEQMIFRYKSDRIMKRKSVYKRIYEEIAYRYLLHSRDDEMDFYASEWNGTIRGCVNRLKEDGIHEFDDYDDDSLGTLFFTNLALVEWNSDHNFRFLSPIFAYHLAALHILRLLLRDDTGESVKEELDRLPPENRYYPLVIAASLAYRLEDERFYSFDDFAPPKSKKIETLAPAVFYDYIKTRLVSASGDEKKYIYAAAGHIRNNTYGDSVLCGEYDIASLVEGKDDISPVN